MIKSRFNMHRSLFRISFLLLCFVLSSWQIEAQSDKKSFTFDDVRQWRTHAVSLSDDGQV